MLKMIAFLLFTFPAFAQQDSDELLEQIVYPKVEIVCWCASDAQFPGGHTALNSYVEEQLFIPRGLSSAVSRARIYVSFTVTIQGNIENVKIRKGIDPEIDEQVYLMILQMPRWIPASYEGTTIETTVMIPIVVEII